MSLDLKQLSLLCQGLKLLYIEDDAMARESTLKLLQNFFQDIITAVDGLDALEKFQNNNFDLIISDISLPKMNGLDMLKKVRVQNEEIPILVLSAYDDSAYFLNAIELDIEGYVLKPLEYEKFFSFIFKIVKKIELFKIARDYQANLEAEVKKRNDEILHKLHFDPLTNLLSRYSFFRDVDSLDTPIILLIDIDKFKVINEVYGSTIGSKVLEKFALYLSLALDDNSCKAYRLSADEFAIVDTTNVIDTDKCELIIEKLFKELSGIKLKVENEIITVDITIGLSTVEHNGYESAKIALDYAKKYKKPYVMYSSAIDYRKESSLTLKCRDNIYSAINDERVVIVYQPIMDKNNNIVKHEALMRLREEGSSRLMLPCSFLDVAIKTRLYEELSSIIIFKALAKIKNSSNILSVNFTYSDIKNLNFLRSLDYYFNENPEVGNRTVFEITEGQAIENYEDVKFFIKRFRAYGIKIAIDDFGSGFSNFEYILEIEPDYLKIDGSLIKNIDKDTRTYTLVEAIVQFSHKLNIKVIAEYVHSKVVYNMLRELNVDEYQGFYFSEPLEEIVE